MQEGPAPVLGTRHEGERTLRGASRTQRGGDDRGSRDRELDMAGVRLHDDGAPSRQGRCSVAARDAEREREVARSEDQDRTNRDEVPPQIRAWSAHRPIGVDVIDGRLRELATLKLVREEPELERRARQLALQTPLEEVRLAHRDRDEGPSRVVERVGHEAEGASSRRRRRPALDTGCRGGALNKLVHVGCRRCCCCTCGRRCRVDLGHVEAARHAVAPLNAPVEAPVSADVRSTSACKSRVSTSVRRCSGGRTTPPSRPTASRPAFTIETP